MMDITPLTNKINLILGGLVAFLSYILGEHWLLFVSYLLLMLATTFRDGSQQGSQEQKTAKHVSMAS